MSKHEVDLSLKEYLKKLLSEKTREDGRKLMDFRKIEIEKNPISQANGSARVRLGETEVLVGVKIGAGEPYPDSPDSGVLISTAELSPIASLEFESGPPREQAIELARVVDRAIRESHMIQFDKLVIKTGEKVWIVFLDMEIINDDGNLFDALTIAGLVALKSAFLPKYDEKKDQIDHRTLTKTKLPLKGDVVLFTFCKLGDTLFLDPTSREEKSLDARLSVGVFNGHICAMQKGGEGTFTDKEIITLVDAALKKAASAVKTINGA